MSTIPDPEPQPFRTIPFTAPGETLSAPPAGISADQLEVPGFVLEGILGRGGTGIVYRATDVRLGRPVALKMLLSGGWATDEERRRFRQEAETLGRLSHPGIVQIHATGEHEGRPWLCLELCDGGCLASRLRGPMPPRAAAQLVERLARAVHAAHEAGIVHRDLKPGNILLVRSHPAQANAEIEPPAQLDVEQWILKITDFGLARRMGQTLQTQSGAIMGTPAYMAPEQARGEARGIGPRTDVWALGAILYECITGRPPFRSAEALDTVLQVIKDDPVPPSHLQARLPGDVETITLKCLEKDPARRYPSAAALADDLAAFAAGRPIQARPVGWMERAVKWVKRRPAVAALAAACLLLFVAGFALVTWGFVTASAARDDANRQADETRRALSRAEEALYRNRISLAEREWSAHNVSRASEVLASCPEQRRGWEWDYLSWLCQGGQHTWRGHKGRVLALAGSGRLVASAGMDGSIRLWDARGEDPPRVRVVGLPPLLGLAFSPDGKRLAAACQDGHVLIYQVAGTASPLRIAAHNRAVGDVAFHPGGELLASAGEDGRVAFWNAATGEPRGAVEGHANTVARIVFDAKGERLASAGYDGVALVWDVKSKKEKARCEGHRGAILGIDFSPDGATLATSGHDGTIRLWNAGTGQASQVIRGHRNMVGSVRFSPDGTQLVSASHDRTVRVWERTTGKELLALAGHTVAVQVAIYGGEGRRLLSGGGDGLVKIWDSSRPPTAIVVQESIGPLRAASITADARTCAALAGNGKVRLSDLRSGRLLATLALPGARLVRMAANARGDIAAAGSDRTVWLWRKGEPKPVPLTRHRGEVVALTWNADGLLASLSADEQAQVWDTRTGKKLAAWRCHDDTPTAACFGTAGRLYTAGKDRLLVSWDARSGEKIASVKLPAGEVLALAMSPDGERLAVCGTEGAYLFAPDLESEPAEVAGHAGAVRAVAWSPGGERLVTAGADGVLKLRDASGAEILTLRGHEGPVHCVAWSPDGRMIVSGGEDETLRIWPGDRVGP